MLEEVHPLCRGQPPESRLSQHAVYKGAANLSVNKIVVHLWLRSAVWVLSIPLVDSRAAIIPLVLTRGATHHGAATGYYPGGKVTHAMLNILILARKHASRR